MTSNPQLSPNEPKSKEKLSKQLEQEQNQRNGHHMEQFQRGGGREEYGGKGTGKKKYKIRHKLDGRDKNGIGNRERKERICTRHGHELSGGGMLEGKGCGYKGG